MKSFVTVATGSLILALLCPADAKLDPFARQEEQQREARREDLRDLREKEERTQEMLQQRELEHPEIMYDDREEDVDE